MIPIRRRPVANKPTVTNEYNGTPPLNPDAWMIKACEARSLGTYLAYWRGWRPQSDAQMDETLARWQTMDCSFIQDGCHPPDAYGPGCPPKPEAMLSAVVKLIGKLRGGA